MQDPIILAFDTATEALSVALYAKQQVYSHFEIAPRMHAQRLLPLIQDLIAQAKIGLSDISAIAFGCGPGSFMGIRLATGMAQGLAFGLKIPVIPISTLQILAQTAYDKTKATDIITGWDARMNEVYWGMYQCDDNGIMQATRDDTLCAPADLDITSWANIGCFFAGNAWNLLSTIPENMKRDTSLYPDAKAMLTIARSKFQNRECVSPENAHPHYVRHRVVHT